MRRSDTLRTAVVLVVALAVAGVSAAGCQRKVEVKSGTITMCTAGEVISNDVKTVKVPANKAGAYRVRTVVVTCDKHAKLATIYAEAQTALAAGDTKLAATKLAAVLAIDPAYRGAKAQADSIKKGAKTVPDTTPAPSPVTTGTPVPPKPGDEPGSNAALSKWAPDTVTGFTAQKLLADALSISREYLPSGTSPASGLVIVAEQFRTAADAKSALGHQVKEPYSKDPATIKVKGRDAYFGTDGKRFAVVGFTDGAVMVALELTAAKSPENLRTLAEQVAAQLP